MAGAAALTAEKMLSYEIRVLNFLIGRIIDADTIHCYRRQHRSHLVLV